MKNFKKWIILLVILLTIIIGITVYVIYKNKSIIIYGIDEQPVESTYKYNTTIKNVSVRNEYYSVKKCINKFYTYYSTIYSIEEGYLNKDEETIQSMKQQKNKYINTVYNMLDEEYIKYKDITIENLTTKLNKIKKMTININDMYVSEKDANISVYFAYGKLIDTSTAQSYDFSMMIKLDMSNETFTVLLGDYINEKYGDIKDGDSIEITYPEEIKSNGHNEYDYEIVNDETYIGDVFNSLRDNMIYDKKTVYERLDDEYRRRRFPTLEDFEKYVKDNIRKISIMSLKSYEKTNSNGNIQYKCLDTKGRYYIINENSTMNCSYILDTYTVDLLEFIEKYEASDKNVKVGLNLEKIREAINAKDFQYVYNKMNKTFRNNNFSNYTDFENYLKSKMFNENIFEYKTIEEKTNTYIVNVIVTNKENSKEESKEIEIIMKLTDTTDYYISFNLSK